MVLSAGRNERLPIDQPAWEHLGSSFPIGECWISAGREPAAEVLPGWLVKGWGAGRMGRDVGFSGPAFLSADGALPARQLMGFWW